MNKITEQLVLLIKVTLPYCSDRYLLRDVRQLHSPVKIGATGSRQLGGTMVMVTVFSVFCCVFCVVVCARGGCFLGVRRWLISTTYRTMVLY